MCGNNKFAVVDFRHRRHVNHNSRDVTIYMVLKGWLVDSRSTSEDESVLVTTEESRLVDNTQFDLVYFI